MKNTPIFTTRNPMISRWQSFVESYLKRTNPEKSLVEIRRSPTMQAVWHHAKKVADGAVISKPEGDFDMNNSDHLAYASSFFFTTAQKTVTNNDIKELMDAFDHSQTDIDDIWPYSTMEISVWIMENLPHYLNDSEILIPALIEAGFFLGELSIDLMTFNFFGVVTDLIALGVDVTAALNPDYINKNYMYRDCPEGDNALKTYGVIKWPLPDNAKIALIGDWGTGNEDAHEFLGALLAEGEDIDCIIHLGDVYYSGTMEEVEDNFIKVIREKLNYQGPVFTIPGNHEYYSYGKGFFHMIDEINKSHPSAKQEASYFCLRNFSKTYQFLGLDTGRNDCDPLLTMKNPGPSLKGTRDYEWAINKIKDSKDFKGKTIMLTHHQLFSRSGEIKSDRYGSSFANPYLYQPFSPYFNNKIAAWYWGHEHSFAMYKNGSFGLNQGRLVGSSSYEASTDDDPYANANPMVPYADNNVLVSTNESTLASADSYYPHVGAIITMHPYNNPEIDYYRYPSWANGFRPAHVELTKLSSSSEKITNPTDSPNAHWLGNKRVEDDDDNLIHTDCAPAVAYVDGQLYVVYKNTADTHGHHNYLYWGKADFSTVTGAIEIDDPERIPTNHHVDTDDDHMSTNSHPAMVHHDGILYVVYKDSHDDNLRWCTYEIDRNRWTKRGKIEDTEEHGNDLKSKHGVVLTVFNGEIHMFFLDEDDERTVKYATCNADPDDFEWDLHNGFEDLDIKAHHKAVPAVAANEDSLFMVYPPHGGSDYKLTMLRFNKDMELASLGTVPYDNVHAHGDNVPQTSNSLVALADEKYLRILYRMHSDGDFNENIAWATYDLGAYNESDQFEKYDFDNGETGTWSGGLPVLCNLGDALVRPQTQDFPGYCMDDEYSFMLYPGMDHEDDQMWSAIQKTY